MYTGTFRDGKQHGTGTLTFADGRKYRGEFRNGAMHGKGVKTWPNGSRYEGQWKRNLPNGEGARLWPDGSKYTGHWKNGKYHGTLGVVDLSLLVLWDSNALASIHIRKWNVLLS